MSGKKYKIGDKLVDSNSIYKITKIKKRKVLNGDRENCLYYEPFYKTEKFNSLICSVPESNIDEACLRKPVTKKKIHETLKLLGKRKNGEEKINILAFSIAEANGFGVVRALVDHPERAHDKLLSLGFNVAFTDVIAVRMKDQPGGLYEVAKILGDAGVNIEYSYAYSGKEGAVLILRVDQVEEAIQKIRNSGATLLERSVFH